MKLFLNVLLVLGAGLRLRSSRAPAGEAHFLRSLLRTSLEELQGLQKQCQKRCLQHRDGTLQKLWIFRRKTS